MDPNQMMAQALMQQQMPASQMLNSQLQNQGMQQAQPPPVNPGMLGATPPNIPGLQPFGSSGPRFSHDPVTGRVIVHGM